MDKTPTTGVPPVMSVPILVGALTGGLVIFGFVLYFVLPNGDYPPVWALGGKPGTLGRNAVGVSVVFSRLSWS